MNIITNRYVLILFSLAFFTLGNLVYAQWVPLEWYYRSIISEFFFVLMYTVVDYGNLRYRYSFAVPHIILLLFYFLPSLGWLFYDTKAQLFSVSIATLAILANAKLLYFLYYKKSLAKLLCSRASTTLASSIEILLFSFILHLGLKGAVLMATMRAIYITIIPKVIFYKNQQHKNARMISSEAQ